jgi:hypothetical protein
MGGASIEGLGAAADVTGGNFRPAAGLKLEGGH